MRLIDLTGQVFGKLTVVARAGHRNNRPLWECKCECGNTCYVVGKLLRNGHVKSCGCYRRENSKRMFTELSTTHGKSHTRVYSIWGNMLQRCENPHDISYKYYGEKGVSVCGEWHDFENFYSWAINNGYADHLTIDRIDPYGNYEPNNCRWATVSEQNRNKRRRNHVRENTE